MVSDNDEKVRRITQDKLTTADLAGAGRDRQDVEPVADTAATEPVTPVSNETEAREERRTLDRRAAASSSSPISRNDQVGQTSQGATAGSAIRSATGSGTAAGTATAMAKETDMDSGPLFSSDEAGNLRSQWDSIQVGFVDEPRRAVEQADALVATAMKRMAEQFAEERSRLEGQWDRGGDVSTEDLRLALRRYRSFFGRLLSV